MKSKRKLVVAQAEEEENLPLPAKRSSSEPIPKKVGTYLYYRRNLLTVIIYLL